MPQVAIMTSLSLRRVLALSRSIATFPAPTLKLICAHLIVGIVFKGSLLTHFIVFIICF